MNLFVGILIENFEEISVRQDFINKIQEINQITMWQKIKDVICLKTEEKPKNEDKFDEIIDEEVIRKYREEDEAKQRSPSLYIFKHDSFVRRNIKIIVRH